jgi:hypothetical protein
MKFEKKKMVVFYLLEQIDSYCEKKVIEDYIKFLGRQINLAYEYLNRK